MVSVWFQVLLTPLIGVLFIVQSPYWSTIGRRVVLSLGGWAPRFHTEFHELRATLVRQHKVSIFAYRTFTFCGRTFQTVLLTIPLHDRRPQPQGASSLVWADPLSLAATDGVSVDFHSCGYLDVSVPRVRFRGLCIHPRMTGEGCPFPPGFPIRTSRD